MFLFICIQSYRWTADWAKYIKQNSSTNGCIHGKPNLVAIVRTSIHFPSTLGAGGVTVVVTLCALCSGRMLMPVIWVAGSTLIKVGDCERRLGGAEREFLQTSAISFLTPLRNFLEGDWRTISVSLTAVPRSTDIYVTFSHLADPLIQSDLQ